MTSAVPARSRSAVTRWIIPLVIGAAWVGFTVLVYQFSQSGTFGVIDFDVYWRGALALREGEALYQGIDAMVYLYPPLLAALLIPVATIPREILWVLWYGIHMLLTAGVTALVARKMPARQHLWLWLSPLFFAPIIEASYIGQVSLLLFILFALTWLAYREGRPGIAGALLALATWIKIYPVIVILYFLWRRDWRVVHSAFIVGIALLLLQIGLVGWGTFQDSFSVLFSLNRAGQAARTSLNASVTGFTYQLFGDYPRVVPLIVSDALKGISRAVLSTALVIAAAWWSRPTNVRTDAAPASWHEGRPYGALGVGTSLRDVRQTPDGNFDLSYSVAVLTALLISPTLWVSGMPPVLFCIWMVWRHSPRRRRMSVIHWLLLISYIVISLYYLFILGYTGDPPLSGLILSVGFYALLALWGIHIRLLGKLSGEETS